MTAAVAGASLVAVPAQAQGTETVIAVCAVHPGDDPRPIEVTPIVRVTLPKTVAGAKLLLNGEFRSLMKKRGVRYYKAQCFPGESVEAIKKTLRNWEGLTGYPTRPKRELAFETVWPPMFDQHYKTWHRSSQSTNRSMYHAEIIGSAVDAKGNAAAEAAAEERTAAAERAKQPTSTVYIGTPSSGDTKRKMTKSEADAKYEADLRKYEAAKRARQAKIDAQNAEEARKQAEHKARQEEAKKALADFDTRNSMYQRVFAEQQRRQREYEVAQERHRKCVGGDQQACDDIRSGKPVVSEVKMAENTAAEDNQADAGEASTSTDANLCVTRPEISLNRDGIKGSTHATVINGCDEPVNIRICLKKSSTGWSCGVRSSIPPQGDSRYWVLDATGEVFVDAVTTASRKRTAMPPGM